MFMNQVGLFGWTQMRETQACTPKNGTLNKQYLRTFAMSAYSLCVFLVVVMTGLQNSVLGIPADWADAVDSADMLFHPGNWSDVSPTLRPAIANGYLATVVTSETMFIGGVFNGHLSTTPSHRAVFPSPVKLELELVTKDCTLEVVGTAVDMKHGEILERWDVSKKSTTIATIEIRYFAHQVYRSVLAAQVSMWRSDEVDPEDGLSILVKRVMAETSPDLDLNPVNVTETKLPKLTEAWTGQTLIAETSNSERAKFAFVTTEVPEGGIELEMSEKQMHVNTTLLTTIHTSVDVVASGDILDACLADFELASQLVESGSLESTHAHAWGQGLYEYQSLAVGTGTKESFALAQVINASLYYILSSAREDYPWGLSPGGLASQGYNGHTFWDQESWMYPPVLLLNQGLARALLEYRYKHIPGAYLKAHNASSYPPKGYEGLMFPWESAFTGEEACPIQASTGKYEQHITGDIAVALRQYYYATGDDDWAVSRALPMMHGIAQFWVSRAVPGKNPGWWDINGVTPPDEFAVNINNSAYTNAVAALSLEFANELVSKFGRDPDPRWLEVAQGLRSSIPYDTKSGITLEFQSYHGQQIKQADVTLLSFPLRFITDPKLASANLRYYANATKDDGPAMTWGAYAAGYLLAGDEANAAALFPRAHANAQSPFYVWMETPQGGTTNFLTGAGGFLGTVGYGYGGIHFFADRMVFRPVVPPSAEYFQLHGIQYRGSVLSIRRNANSKMCSVTILSQQRYAPDLTIETGDGQYKQKLSKVGDVAHVPVDTECKAVPAV
jgi:trehalose/maltose hydrolase-like predicted phosphorylase